MGIVPQDRNKMHVTSVARKHKAFAGMKKLKLI